MILTLNAGSSSIKFALFETWTLDQIACGQIERIGAHARMQMRRKDREVVCRDVSAPDHVEALTHILDAAQSLTDGGDVFGVGHRIVHGGADFVKPCALDEATLLRLDALDPLAPLHQPHNLATVRAAKDVFPHAIQIGCFDTAFHRGQPFVCEAFGLPRRYYDAGVRRYGFHGLSYDYVSGELKKIAPDIADQRVIIAHLGNGASMCALKGGKSFASSMGFSTLDGLPMGTRCGQIDPGVLLYLMQHEGMQADDIAHLLYQESGLLGLSGISHDMRTLEQSEAPEARQAIEYFIFRIRRELGALAGMMGGVDALVFCGGIGEHSARVRAGVCADLGWLGFALDAAKNDQNVSRLDASGKPIFVVPTNEEIVIARAVRDALKTHRL